VIHHVISNLTAEKFGNHRHMVHIRLCIERLHGKVA
jgi:hypothetical protein